MTEAHATDDDPAGVDQTESTPPGEPTVRRSPSAVTPPADVAPELHEVDE